MEDEKQFYIKIETKNGEKIEAGGNNVPDSIQEKLIDDVLIPHSDKIIHHTRNAKELYQEAKFNEDEEAYNLSNMFHHENLLEPTEKEDFKSPRTLKEIAEDEEERLKAENYQNSILENPNQFNFAKIQEIKGINVDSLPEHVKTGIKYKHDDEIPHYKCHYMCACGNNGNHYITPSRNVVSCHECDRNLIVEKATDNETHEQSDRDSYGNFYTAIELAK